MSENEIRVLYVQPGKYPEERTIPNTLRALQELVGGDIECCRPWRDSVCVICNDSGKIDGLPPNRLYGHTDFLAGSFVVCGNGGEDFISLTDRQVFLYERLYHNPVVFLPTPHGLLPMKCTPEQYEQFQRDGNKLNIYLIVYGDLYEHDFRQSNGGVSPGLDSLNYILIYKEESPMTSPGVSISSSAGFAQIHPTKAIIIPLTSASAIAVCTVSDISLSFPAA